MLVANPVLGAILSITRFERGPNIPPNTKTPCTALHFLSGGCRSIEPELYPRPDGTVYVCGEPAEVPVPDGGPAAVGLEQKSLQVLQVGGTTAEAVSLMVLLNGCQSLGLWRVRASHQTCTDSLSLSLTPVFTLSNQCYAAVLLALMYGGGLVLPSNVLMHVLTCCLCICAGRC